MSDTELKLQQKLIGSFCGQLIYIFRDLIEYIGTTTDLQATSNSIRDVDIIIIFKSINESHIVHLWRIIRKLRSEYNLDFDARIYQKNELNTIPELNRYLLSFSLQDLFGINPFKSITIEHQDLQRLAHKRIQDQIESIIRSLPRVAVNHEKIREIAQFAFDAMRAFLIFIGKPEANKEKALSRFKIEYPDFEEVNLINDAYIDPGSIFDISEFIVSSLFFVRHLLYKSKPYILSDNVLLINTPSFVLSHPQDDYLSYDKNMPLGLVCLASYLNRANVTTKILDCYAENLGAMSAIDRIFSKNELPKIIGFNACSPNINIVHKMAKYIKRIDSRIAIVCGGPHATLDPEHTLQSGVDYAVIGEGELPAFQLFSNLISQNNDNNIKGVVSKGKTKTLPWVIEDLSCLPIPDFSLLPTERYFKTKNRIYIHTTRGCAFNCIYCSVPKSMGKNVRTIPIQYVIRNVKHYIEKLNATELQIVDDNFSHQKGAIIKEFCKALLEDNIRIAWKCQLRADQINKETIMLMKKCSCFEIDLGIESGSKRIQRYIRKNLDLQKTRELVSCIHNNDITCKAFFMLGFPNETYDEIAETINYSINLKSHGLKDIAFFPVMPFPGTELSKITKRTVHQGAIIDDTRFLYTSYSNQKLRKYSAMPEVSLNDNFSPLKLRFLVKFAYEKFEIGQTVTDLKKEFEECSRSYEAEQYAL